ncbi:MAG: hypothetical protein SFY32_06815 [Bacteroidota bacterium]|nr:hypothetical protein [Bacteroidota bacterium]
MYEQGYSRLDFKSKSTLKWNAILDFVFLEADSIEFEISKSVMDDFYLPVKSHLKKHPYKDSFSSFRYSNEQFGKVYNWDILYFKFKLDQTIIRDLTKSKNLFDFAFDQSLNFSFYKGNECIAYSILSENSFCIKLNESNQNILKVKGIKFSKPFHDTTPEQWQKTANQYSKKLKSYFKENPELREFLI